VGKDEKVKGRKIFARYSVLFLLLLVSLVGCGAWEKTGEERELPLSLRIGLVVPRGEEGGTGSVLQEAVERGMAALDGKIEIIAAEPDEYITALRELADRGNELVWGIGEDMEPALGEVITLYPEKKFVLVHGALSAANVVSLSFREEEPAFLAGVMAGAVSNTGRVGFIATPGTASLLIPIAAGIYELEPAAQIFGETLVELGPGSAAAVAAKQLNRGADVIILAPGVKSEELLEFLGEREQTGVLICLDNFAQPDKEGLILASLGWDTAFAVEDTLGKLLEEFTPGRFQFGVKDGFLLVKEGRKLPPEVQYFLGSYRRLLAEGQITVPTREEELAAWQNRAATGSGVQGESRAW